MKIINEKITNVTGIKGALMPQLQALQLEVKYVKRNILPETDDEHKLFQMSLQCGSNPSEESFYHVTFKPLLIKDKVYLLQNKKQIKALYEYLNIPMIDSGACCICGKKYTDDYSYSYEPWNYVDTRIKCCKRRRYIGKCFDIRERLIWILKIMLNRIEKLERRFICENCNKKYMPKRSDSKFYSIKCRVANHRRQKTKKITHIHLSKINDNQLNFRRQKNEKNKKIY